MPFDGTLVPPQCHSVSFFTDDEQLCSVVGHFVSEGLAIDEPALIVTNEAHRDGIIQYLRDHAVDVDDAIARGDLLLVDAEDTLAGLMAGDLPNAALYHENIGTAVTQLLRGRPGPLRIFGDMVDLLWQRGQYDAAIRIEILSNQLAALQPISVICGYSMGHFLKTAAKLEEVRALHGREHRPLAMAAERAAKPARRSARRLL